MEVNNRQGVDTRTIQRAYVKISHPPPGIEQLDDSGNIWLRVSIKNFGQTPATVSQIVVKPVVVGHDDPLPTVPDYTYKPEGPAVRAFLVTNAESYLSRLYRITTDEMSRVKNLLSDLYMIGFVDYIDQFGQGHRGGYARQYLPMIDRASYGRDRAHGTAATVFTPAGS